MARQLNCDRRRKGVLTLVSPVEPQALRFYTNWDVAVGAHTHEEPWTTAPVPKSMSLAGAGMALRQRGKWIITIDPSTIPGIKDTEVFYIRMVKKGGTFDDLMCIVPPYFEDNPVFPFSGTAITAAFTYIPFGRTASAFSVINMDNSKWLVVKYSEFGKELLLPAGASISETANLAGLYVKGDTDNVSIQGTVTLVSGGA